MPISDWTVRSFELPMLPDFFSPFNYICTELLIFDLVGHYPAVHLSPMRASGRANCASIGSEVAHLAGSLVWAEFASMIDRTAFALVRRVCRKWGQSVTRPDR